MIYVDTTPVSSEGRTRYWRVFADTTGELQRAARRAGSAGLIYDEGEPHEHIVVTTTEKRMLRDATELDDRGKVKLFRRKRRGEILPPDPEPQEADDAEGIVSFFMVAQQTTAAGMMTRNDSPHSRRRQ